MNRVTAVVVDGLPQSCVAAVSRLVLVGRGGLRLHEEVFLTGIRMRGRAMAEEKAEEVLDQALDAAGPGPRRTSDVRAQLARACGTPTDAPLRARLLTAMDAARPTRRQEQVIDALRQAAGRRRRAGAGDLRRVPRQPAASPATGCDAGDPKRRTSMLFPDDQQRQRRRDIASMIDRLDEPRRRGAARDRRDQRPLRRHQAARHRGRRRVRADPATTPRPGGSS